MSERMTCRPEAEPGELSVGMRFSLHPHCDDFVAVILDALEDAREMAAAADLVVESDEVSSYVAASSIPAEEQLVRYLAAVVTAAFRRSNHGHVVAQVLLSRGCPGEVSCDLAVTSLPQVQPVHVPATGVECIAQWSLYPLLDGGSPAGDHMAHIEAAIESARRRGVASAPAHYATRLTGDVADVLATVADAWAAVGATVAHVVSHLTLSVGSPSVETQDVR
ncbi:MAG: YkoF family thiamine/hydroxymethylpyrimidine-binding protein [Pseudonocardiaceae bacterium]